MFNIMRGGIFDNNYQIEKWDLIKYLESANKQVFQSFQDLEKAIGGARKTLEEKDGVPPEVVEREFAPPLWLNWAYW